MNVLILSGSRNPEGQTAQACEALAEGIRAGGGQSKTVFLPALRIERCRQCDAQGWGLCRTEARCVIEEDDFTALLGEMRSAEAVVCATPVYFGDLSESLRALLERVRRVCRHVPDKNPLAGKPAVGVAVAGGGGGGSYSCLTSLERMLSTCGLDVLDLVPVRRQNLPMKRAVLRVVGQWLAQAKV